MFCLAMRNRLQLCLWLQGFQRPSPSTVELASCRLAFDDEQRINPASWVLGTNPDVGASRLVCMAEFPSGFQFYILRFVTFLQQSANALEHDKVLVLGEVGGRCARDGNPCLFV